MLAKTIQLETLRQKIEDVQYEAAMHSDYLDRGGADPGRAKKAQDLVNTLNQRTKTLQAEFKELIGTVRSQQPQVIEEWVDVHIGMLQKIVDEKAKGPMGSVRRNVARETLQEWEKVRAGEQDYVGINWYYLKDYKARARKIGKSWWQFWK
jgi:hypothetical protein